MTKRELAFGASALVVGIAVGVLFFRRPPASPSLPVTVDARVVADVDAAPSAPEADVPEAETPPPDEAPSVDASRAIATGDAARSTPKLRDAGPDAPAIVVRASNLLIHPSANEHLCVDAPSRGHGLQLYRCHGRKNQRWTFAEDITGANRIFGSEGGCVRVAGAQGGNEPTLDVGACGPDAPRFRHRADRRLEEVQSGQCVTVRALEKHAKLVLEPCDPSNGGQGWTFSP
jgi:hypothetical protein